MEFLKSSEAKNLQNFVTVTELSFAHDLIQISVTHCAWTMIPVGHGNQLEIVIYHTRCVRAAQNSNSALLPLKPPKNAQKMILGGFWAVLEVRRALKGVHLMREQIAYPKPPETTQKPPENIFWSFFSGFPVLLAVSGRFFGGFLMNLFAY